MDREKLKIEKIWKGKMFPVPVLDLEIRILHVVSKDITNLAEYFVPVCVLTTQNEKKLRPKILRNSF